jgi:hypothetical protein
MRVGAKEKKTGRNKEVGSRKVSKKGSGETGMSMEARVEGERWKKIGEGKRGEPKGWEGVG